MRMFGAYWRLNVGFHKAAPERPVNTTLNEDLVRRARGITPNLSETVEGLLAAFVDDAEAKAVLRERHLSVHIATNDAFVAKNGSFGDEFSTL